MTMGFALLSAGLMASVLLSAVQAQEEPCCTSDADCVAMQNDGQLEYNARFGKSLICDLGCPGLVNCNMFGLCDNCRGCFNTCEGAIAFIQETAALEDSISFCPDGEVDNVSACYEAGDESVAGSGSGSGSASASDLDGSGSGFGSGSGIGSGTGSGGGSRSGSGSGTGSGSRSSSSGYGSGSGTGYTSRGGLISGSGSGEGSGSRSGSGSQSGTAFDSGVSSLSESASGSGSASGEGGASADASGASSSSGSATAGREADIPGCTCGDAVLSEGEAAFFCDNGKSMYCDVECVPGSDPMERLFYEMGGLWCQPFGWEGCRLCKFDCTDYNVDGDGYCVPCPPGMKDFCDV